MQRARKERLERFGRWLRHSRLSKDIPVKALADAAGISTHVVYMYERAEIEARDEYRVAFERVLGEEFDETATSSAAAHSSAGAEATDERVITDPTMLQSLSALIMSGEYEIVIRRRS